MRRLFGLARFFSPVALTTITRLETSEPSRRGTNAHDKLEQTRYFEADLVKIKGLLHDRKMLWDEANSQGAG
jgi:hypothetical protein